MGTMGKVGMAVVLSLALASGARSGDVERAALFAAMEEGTQAVKAAASESRAAPAAADTGVADEIRAFNAPRVDLNLDFLKEKLLRIAAGPWPFMRGTDHLYYRALATDPALSIKQWVTPATCKVVVQGDLHVQNIGCSENGNGKIRFDIQDFDDSTRAPYIVDVVRAAASVIIMADETSISADDAREAARQCIATYVDSIDAVLDGSLDPDFSFKKDDAKGPVQTVLERAHATSRKELLKKRLKDGKFKRGDRYFDLDDKVYAAIVKALPGKKVKDAVRKKSNGVGSLGQDDYLVLIPGTDDDVILEVKQETKLSIAPYLSTLCNGDVPAGLASDSGERAILAQKAMQSSPERFADSVKMLGKSYIVREDSPFKDAPDATDVKNAKDLQQLGEAIATLAAKAHARQSQDPKGAQSIGRKIRAAIGDKKAFVSGVLDIAVGFAKRNRAEYREYLRSPLAKGQW